MHAAFIVHESRNSNSEASSAILARLYNLDDSLQFV